MSRQLRSSRLVYGALVAAVMVPAGVQAQVVQGMTVGAEGGVNRPPSTSGAAPGSFADARSRVVIYANGPSVAFAPADAAGNVGASGSYADALAKGGAAFATEPGGGGGVSPVPEPDTWTMLILGFGMAGFAMRRRTARPLPA